MPVIMTKVVKTMFRVMLMMKVIMFKVMMLMMKVIMFRVIMAMVLKLN